MFTRYELESSHKLGRIRQRR